MFYKKWMFSGITSSLLCEQPHRKKGTSETVGTHQYVANRLIEDRVSHSFLEAGKKRFELVTVIDGHGGSQVAEYLTRELPNFISHELGKISPPNQSMADALRSAFLLADDRWFSLVEPAYKLGFTAPIKAGACAIAVLLNESEIVVASVGDCKCIIATNGSVKDLNIERNANRDEEQARLRQQHPGEPDVVKCRKSWTDPLVPSKKFFSGCYVKGRLQPTKSFGDFHLKISSVLTDPERGSPFLDPSSKRTHPYIDADPDVTVTLRDPGDYFLIAATDGLWDQFSSEEAAKIVESAFKSGLSPQQAAETLVEAALLNAAKTRNISLSDLKALPQGSARRNVHDDISVCIVLLR